VSARCQTIDGTLTDHVKSTSHATLRRGITCPPLSAQTRAPLIARRVLGPTFSVCFVQSRAVPEENAHACIVHSVIKQESTKMGMSYVPAERSSVKIIFLVVASRCRTRSLARSSPVHVTGLRTVAYV
jgi:hypothetical protein